MEFELHPNLTRKLFIKDLPLCRVLLENHCHYPWLLLVPRRPNISRLIDLSPPDQQQLYIELDIAQRILWEQFHPTQLNVAAIGNKTPQLHVHVIARNTNDPAWPGTVWDHPIKSPYPPDQQKEVQQLLINLFESIDSPED